jgi:hypothetical protein
MRAAEGRREGGREGGVPVLYMKVKKRRNEGNLAGVRGFFFVYLFFNV